MTGPELICEKEKCLKEYEEFKKRGLSLDMSRGKPSHEQLKYVLPLLDTLCSNSNTYSRDGFDCLNYGCGDGLPECKELFAELLSIPAEKIYIGCNSSLTLMYDYLMQCYAMGVLPSKKPWILQGKVKFLCPSPGYDRHFKIAEYLGFDLITVAMTATGPDMDEVEKYALDESVKGIFCIPKYSNPTGVTYSDETLFRLARMKAADDFRIIWDNAYCVHDLFGSSERVGDILSECEKAGNPDRAVLFASSSKITFPGSGVALLAANENNLKYIKARCAIQTIGTDKANQLRHVRFLKDAENVKLHMRKFSELIRPKFETVLSAFERELEPLKIASWSKPKGGYFISLDVEKGCAKRVFELCKEGGVKLTGCGATYPYGIDPEDKNIRIAPTFPSLEELRAATELLIISVKLASLEKLIAEKV